jgi:hypothetical protein
MEKKIRSSKTVKVLKQVAASIAPQVAKVAKAVGAQPKVGPEEFYRRVSHKAYELYISRGTNHGDDQSDWFEAERLVRADLGI